tara:strand:- start:457 stop:1443 length:987 start_codon:yes stop_codon:yes gene_type:complete
MNLRPLNSNPFQNFRIPSNYLVNDAKILGMSNLILNKKNICAINNIVFNIRNNNKIFHESEKSITYDNKNIFFDVINEENISKGVFLGSNWNYGHWLFNHLARLYYCQSSYKDCHIIVNNSIDAEKFEVLKYFNIPKENIKILNSGTLLNVEKLIIPQMPWHSLNGLLWWAPNSFKFLRESLGCNKILNSECKLNIFITRSTARWRKVTNEIQLFNIAKKYNFELIDIGTLTVDEQINLGRQTRNLISPFGANSNFFINIPSGAKFLELAPPLDRMNVSGPFSVASQIEYIQLIGRPDKKENQRDLDSDYIIDESVFQKKIQEFCDID